MPTVACDKEELWKRLGRAYCEHPHALCEVLHTDFEGTKLQKSSTICYSNSASSLMKTYVALKYCCGEFKRVLCGRLLRKWKH